MYVCLHTYPLDNTENKIKRNQVLESLIVRSISFNCISHKYYIPSIQLIFYKVKIDSFSTDGIFNTVNDIVECQLGLSSLDI
jgi:hypothetical protein